MDLHDFFKDLFNPLVEKHPEPSAGSGSGFLKLIESKFASSYVTIDDQHVRAFEADGNFEQSKLFNPSKVLGYRCLHDYILTREESGCLELFFVEMKAETDKFEHIRHQLQNGIALLAYIQRLSMDRLGIKWPLDKIHFYAAVLFHTGKLPPLTNLKKRQDVVEKRKDERAKYGNVKGVYCVENNHLIIPELKKRSAVVSYCVCFPNGFPEFPSEIDSGENES